MEQFSLSFAIQLLERLSEENKMKNKKYIIRYLLLPIIFLGLWISSN